MQIFRERSYLIERESLEFSASDSYGVKFPLSQERYERTGMYVLNFLRCSGLRYNKVLLRVLLRFATGVPLVTISRDCTRDREKENSNKQIIAKAVRALERLHLVNKQTNKKNKKARQASKDSRSRDFHRFRDTLRRINATLSGNDRNDFR